MTGYGRFQLPEDFVRNAGAKRDLADVPVKNQVHVLLVSSRPFGTTFARIVLWRKR
jgi:hypothetical protein